MVFNVVESKLSENECPRGWCCISCPVSHSDETGTCIYMYIHTACTCLCMYRPMVGPCIAANDFKGAALGGIQTHNCLCSRQTLTELQYTCIHVHVHVPRQLMQLAESNPKMVSNARQL